jgi:hypothetical protein
MLKIFSMRLNACTFELHPVYTFGNTFWRNFWSLLGLGGVFSFVSFKIPENDRAEANG